MEEWEQAGALWRKVLATLGVWSVVLDRAGGVLEVDREVENATGISKAEIVGRPFWALVAREEEAALLRERIFPLRGEEGSGFVVHVAARGRDPLVIEWSAVDAWPESERALLVGVDRTQPREQGQALRRDRDWYRRLLGQLPAVFWTTDRELSFTSSSGAGLARLGVQEGQLVSVPLARYFGSSDDDNIARHRAALAGDTVRYDTEWLGRTFQTVVAPLRDEPEGEPSGTIGLAFDITDRVRAEAERDRSLAAEREARREAERSLAARDEFLSIAAHELYTPLTSLALSLQSVAGGQVAGDAAQRLIRVAERQTQRLLTLAEKLLDVSRIQSGRLDLDLREDVDLAAIAREVAARFEAPFAQASRSLEVRAEEPVCGCWDPDRVDQIVANFVANALRHAPGSDVVLEVEATARGARVAVTDDGPGVPEGMRDTIFERFERGASLEHHGGLGLGLFIAHEITQAHGGAIGLIGPAGGGARFWVELPRRAGARARARASASAEGES